MELVLIALWAAIYPTLLAAVLILLNTQQPRKLLSTYLFGGMLMSVTAGLAVVAALQGSNAIPSSKSQPSWIADVVAGALMLLLALAVAKGADQRVRERRRAHRAGKQIDEKQPLTQRVLARGSVPIVFFAGLVVNLPGAAYLIALKDIAGGHHSVGVVIFQVLLFNVIMFLIAEVTLFFLLFQPERAHAAVERMDSLLTDNGRRIAVWVSASLGTFLIVRGVAHSG